MPPTSELRTSIEAALQAMQSRPFADVARELLDTLGYRSDRRLQLADAKPETFLDLLRTNAATPLDEAKALTKDWKSASLLFQLTDEDLSGHLSLFPENGVNASLLQSYVFLAVELSGGDYSRGKLTGLARQLNRAFPMPVMVLIKHTTDKRPVLSIAVINRRLNKRDAAKDVLGKVTIIRDISLAAPHRGHLDILDSFALPNLLHPQRLPINSFDTLHAAWEEIFNVELLNKRFYRELANWYFWALPQVTFPLDTLKPEEQKDKGALEKHRATGLIRLLTRIIFCWFLKEKGLVPDRLFVEAELKDILKKLDADESTYYQAILQNLFFATLNQRMGKDKNGLPYRAFAKDEGFQKNKSTYGVDTLYRYEDLFKNPDTALDLFSDVPFLNGGLFECLDREDEKGKKLYLDGFSRNKNKRPTVPNRLFFAGESTVNLSEVFGDAKKKNEKVRGLLRILHSYKFTIVENTPIDQEIALDPELLGKVFENLLASYNEETKTTARKQTGSFYTPRPIVEYMVDESLKAHLRGALVKAGMKEGDTQAGLDLLFMYTEREHPFSEAEADALLAAIHTCKILDPACGSGAFPMGMLHKLVYIIHKLDPDNAKWKQLQIDAASAIPDSTVRETAIAAIEKDFAENEDDYGRKLYLIQNCLYGVDIQPIAIQISKLRFFISLVADQRTSRNKKENHGIRPLPNLETKFVAADTLISLPEMQQMELAPQRVYDIEKEIERLYHDHFTPQRRDQKLALQRKVKELRKELGKLLGESLMAPRKAQHVADWDAFDPQSSADFFDPHWMFGRSLADGFDILLGNPPYVQIQKFPAAQKAAWQARNFKTYSATADIYCLFYERGVQLLRAGGHLCYITSNKWMRAGYGEDLRGYLSRDVDTRTVLDFGMAQNFGAATTYTCIVQVTKRPYTARTRSCYATDDRAAMADPNAYFEQNSVVQKHLSSAPWVVISKDRQRIKDLVEAQGVPLEKWEINIYRGVLTGFNDAFYITQEQRDAFIAEDPDCEEILVPLLRGRHIERYATNWDGGWMINTHNGVKDLDIPRIDVRKQYPVIWNHLQQWEKELSKRLDRGDHWTNLRNCAYLKEFDKPKIMYPNMTKYLPFYYDHGDGFYTNDKGFVVTSGSVSLCYLAAFLNSDTFRCCFRDNFPELMGNTYEVRKIFVDAIPVKKPSPEQEALFDRLVPVIQFARLVSELGAAQFLEDLIDACVMECYFREHMAERDLLFLDEVAPHLEAYNPKANESQQREFLTHLYQTLNAPDAKVRNHLLRLTADSPDLLAVIKEEGRV
jgi:adenine-specific DNA-methyltransferase